MATCNLVIRLDEPNKTYTDGEKVRGEVIVTVPNDLACRGLVVSTIWATHGRGNVDRGDVAQQEVFSGEWQAGREYRYPFELETARWPPTYYGNYINVSHHVLATARLSWQRDPEVRVEIPVTTTGSAAELQPQRKTTNGPLAWILVVLIVGLIVVAATMMLPFVLVFLGIPALIVWFVNTQLPRWYTGDVKFQIDAKQYRPGDTVRATVSFTPRRSFAINELTIQFECAEICMSGTGSNRKTHQTTVAEFKQSLLDRSQMMAGQPQSLQCEYTLPPNAPPSLDLSDNDVRWRCNLKIDIPRWPDLNQHLDFIVAPGDAATSVNAEALEVVQSRNWLNEVVDQLQRSADNPERLSLVLNAIATNDFKVNVVICQHGTESKVRPTSGVWVEAADEDAGMDFVIEFPADEAPVEEEQWIGTIRIIEYLPKEKVIVASAVT